MTAMHPPVHEAIADDRDVRPKSPYHPQDTQTAEQLLDMIADPVCRWCSNVPDIELACDQPVFPNVWRDRQQLDLAPGAKTEQLATIGTSHFLLEVRSRPPMLEAANQVAIGRSIKELSDGSVLHFSEKAPGDSAAMEKDASAKLAAHRA
jgi:hypothetical protein